LEEKIRKIVPSIKTAEKLGIYRDLECRSPPSIDLTSLKHEQLIIFLPRRDSISAGRWPGIDEARYECQRFACVGSRLPTVRT
jgi:hypothetical protein